MGAYKIILLQALIYAIKITYILYFVISIDCNLISLLLNYH